MDMDMMEEFTGYNGQTMIVRGKRSKRARQSSPSSVISASSNDAGGSGGGGDGERTEINSSIPSLSLCSEISTSTEEDEDMANCLILLAQSGCHQTRPETIQEGIKMEKMISTKKLSEMATTTIAYECKTCNRSFPSFQALGGHRASHKKPKQQMEDEKKPIQITSSSLDNHHQEQNHQKQEHQGENQVSIAKKSSHGGFNKGSKIHECSICGLEFTSGQALGGHMRRHRTSTTSSKVSNLSNDAITIVSSNERPRNILQLDLNLPAPEDDHHHDSKFQFSANQQQHLFSSMALVDCHY